ncbi:MAG: transcriptional regulator [Ignavibacteriaceae bacterium]|jgi:HTH-type transcriptional regulator/antitoxin HigA|nr:transcriptional regulator [Ignavibacteriaceae bacterium]
MNRNFSLQIKPIRTKKTYKEALVRIYELMQKDLAVDNDEYDELELLSILVEDYEKKFFPINLPDPIEAIKFRLEQLNLEDSALISILGSKSRASEILNRKRKLSLSMIRALNNKLKIPASSLIANYHD